MFPHTDTHNRPIIAVLGGSGPFGAPYVDEFLDQGLTVRILARSPDTVAPRFPRARVRRGSLLNIDHVADIMDEAAAAFLITPVGGNDDVAIERMAARCAIAAAKRTRLPHLIYLSLIQPTPTTGVPMLDVKGRIEDMLHRAGIPFSSLRTGCYMDTWLNFFPLCMRLGIYMMPIGPGHRFSFTAQRDVARVAASLVRRDTILKGAVDVVDPRPRSVQEVVHLYHATTGRHLAPAGRWLLTPLTLLRPILLRWLYPKGASRIALFNHLSHHDWVGDSDTMARAFPRFRITTMEEYIYRNCLMIRAS